MAEHFDANKLTIGTLNLVFFDEIGDFTHLLHVQFTRQHHYISKGRVEAQSLFVGNIELGGEMYLLIDGAAIAKHSHVCRNHSRDLCLFRSIANFAHESKVFAVDDGVHCEITFYTLLFTLRGDVVQVLDGELACGVRTHVERFYAKIDGVGTSFEGSGKCFA